MGISIPTAMLIAGGVGAASSVASGVIGSNAAESAAKTQATAANTATAEQQRQFDITQGNLQPFISAGTLALPELQKLTGTNAGGDPLTSRLTAPFNPTISQLEQTPGYKFTLDQGLQAAQNGFASQGLAGSGPAIKGATNYAEGLAGTTFQQQFQNYLSQNQQIYNMLGGITGSGQNAAAGLGSLALNTTSAITGLQTGGAAATAAGTVGSANAISGALGGIGTSASNTALLTALSNAGMFGNGGGNTGGLIQPG